MSEVITESGSPEQLKPDTAALDNETEKSERATKLPLARIRTLIKADPHVTIASQESVFLIAKSTELFIDSLAKNMYKITQQQKRKTMYKKDLETVIEILDEFAFLEGTTD
uniref:Transcription factor CBF/NF-Y/archaeal histone domain-containing protein n=1 Tax=Ciona savignyi TaxID=51511 RepID=H2ZN87_CIOSA